MMCLICSVVGIFLENVTPFAFINRLGAVVAKKSLVTRSMISNFLAFAHINRLFYTQICLISKDLVVKETNFRNC